MEQESEKNQDQEQKTDNIVSKFKSFKKTPFLIAGLVILTGILLAVSLNLGSEPKSPTSNATQEDFAHTSLSISEEIRESTVSGVFEVDVNIDTNDDLVTGVQLELEYDPEALTKVDVVNGDFLENPNILIKEINENEKRITFVAGKKPEQSSVSGEGVIAVISFEKVTDEPTYINFLPQTLVSAEGLNQSVLKETISTIIGELPSL